MATKITRDIIESYLNCKYKGHLKLAGQQGDHSDYELLLTAARQEVRRQAIDKILARYPAKEVARDVPLTLATLKQGTAFLLDVTLVEDHFDIAIDGLKRVPGHSKLGDFHYVPVAFAEGREVRKVQRALLDVFGALLAPLQGRAPATGILWHGRDCIASRVQLHPDPHRAERLLEELRQLHDAGSPPRLVLNDHCALCEFRQRCQQQATQEDNISLLRGMTGPFGTLLRAIVTTVDEHGLKRCHLKKHDRDVAQFFAALTARSFRSESAAALRERLLKNRDRLFTFIRHEGVPWNNTNAEHAIKRFAAYRENTVGLLKERGLRDYLVLLSVCQTCRYRGIRFLRFLLSRERDLDAFGTRWRARRRRPVIETYPKGYVPPHLARLRARAMLTSAEPTEQVAEEES